MGYGAKLSKQPSPKVRSGGWVEASCSFFRGTKGFQPMPEDRGAEQGNVDAPLECSLALGIVASETRLPIAQQRDAGTLP